MFKLMPTSTPFSARKLNGRGFAHLLLLLLLGAGLVATVYLITSGNPLKLFSKASMSRPTGPETSFSLVGPQGCTARWLCVFSGQHQLQEEFEVALYVRSDIETANLFTAKMIFPANLVEVKEIKIENSFIRNWVENFYDNNTGEIFLSGGVTAPGFQTQVGGESALMAKIVFKAKALGKGVVALTDSSAIYSNLNNIDILTIKRGYSISIEVKPSPPPISGPISPPPAITPTPTPLPIPTAKGDGNKDNKINLIDMSIIHTDWMKTKDMTNFRINIDMNDDGLINTFDFAMHRALLARLGVIKTQDRILKPDR